MEPLHAVVERAKTLAALYYPSGQTFTVMNECGGGGSRDVLAIVQRFPNDLDVAVAVNFTNYGTRHGVSQMWLYDATHRTPDSVLPTSKLPILHQAALDRCDMNDGVKDGVIENPPACKFDPAVLRARAPTVRTASPRGRWPPCAASTRRRGTNAPGTALRPDGAGSELGWGRHGRARPIGMRWPITATSCSTTPSGPTSRSARTSAPMSIAAKRWRARSMRSTPICAGSSIAAESCCSSAAGWTTWRRKMS